MAGRPRRPDFFGYKEVVRETVRWKIDKRLADAVRDLCTRHGKKARSGKPSVSQVAEGIVWWGLYCAANHRDEEESPEWTYEEADQAGLTPLLRKNSKLGTLTKDGHFIPDPEEEPSENHARSARRRST